MLIFKVMVCFLAVFNSEDCVGGLPTIQDSPDNHHAVQSGRSASNQGVTNEPVSRSTVLLDYAERDEEEVHQKIKPDIKMITNPVKIASIETSGERFGDKSAPGISSIKKKIEKADQMLKFQADIEHENENVRRDILRGGASSADQFVDKSKSKNEAATSTSYSSESPTASLEAKEKQRFSSVYTKVDLDDKVNKKKEEFKNDLSAYLTDVLDTVAGEKSPTTSQTSTDKSEKDHLESGQKVQAQNNTSQNSGDGTAGTLLSEKTSVPMPEEESSKIPSALEFRQRKSIGDIVIWHQQSTNMKPTRTQHLVQNKRSAAEGTLVRLPGYGGRRSTAKNTRAIEGGGARGSNRRHFTTDGSSSLRENRLQFAGLSPVQINAAAAYGNGQQSGRGQGLNVDISRPLYQFGPANLQALRGVFDKVPPATQNFKPIAPKQVAYVPPKIVYETKLVPTPFMPFITEQKTVDALSALLGQNPAQQLQGFNLILGKDRPGKPEVESTPQVSLPKISHEVIHQDGIALGQAYVTPIPSIDINSGLGDDNSFIYSPNGGNAQEEIVSEIERPFNHKVPQYNNDQENINPQENPFRTIPIVEEPEESQRGQAHVEKEINPVWEGAEIPEKTRDQNEGRYSQHNEEDRSHGDGYAANYSFGYHVKDYESGNDFGHQETRDGVITNGRYHVLLPDGRLQNVKYHVDEGGYHAKVSYQLNPSV